MIKPRNLAITAALAASLALGGCVSLLPKTKPAQLYRFGDDASASAQPAPALAGGSVVGVRLSTGFTHAAEGDRILTSSGAQTAYVAQARWLSPASVLFSEAAERAFENSTAPLRLLGRGDMGSASVTVRLDVETFEADYAPGWSGAPTVVVKVRALLMRSTDSGPPAEMVFESRQPASENRVSAIVTAYDAATEDVLAHVVAWTAAQAGSPSASG